MKNTAKYSIASLAFMALLGCAQPAKDTSELFSKPYAEERSSLFFMGSNENDILSPQEAFKFQYQIREASVNVLFDIAPGHYVYRDKIELRRDGVKIENINDVVVWPPSTVVSDPNFGSQSVFKGQVDIAISKDKIGGDTKELELLYYGCSPQGICYAPEVEKISMLSNTGYISYKSTDVVAKDASILFQIGLIMLALVVMIGGIFWIKTRPTAIKSIEKE